MSIPPPAILAFTGLLGWPTIQLISVLIARPKIRRLRSIAADLMIDPRYGPDDHALIERQVRDARGQMGLTIFTLIVPLAIIAAALAELFERQRSRPSQTDTSATALAQSRRELRKLERRAGLITGDPIIEADPRYRELRDLSFEVSFIRWPISAILTIVASLPTLPLYVAAYGTREALSVIPRFARRFADLFRLSPLAT